jgi:hypothetical protein
VDHRSEKPQGQSTEVWPCLNLDFISRLVETCGDHSAPTLIPQRQRSLPMEWCTCHWSEETGLSNGSILICMELLRSTSESGQEAAACCLVVPKGTWPLIILLPDQVHRRTCLYLQSGRKINYSLWCLYQHLSRHTGPQHFLVYCSVRMAKYFFITINSGQLNFA